MENNHATILGFRRSAIVEIILFLGIAVLLDIIIFSGHRYIEVAPHPFWIIVLLVSAQYGTSEGVLAAVAATLALYAGHLPEQQIGENTYDYLLSLTKIPLMWFIGAVIFGELRQKHIRERTRLLQDLGDAREREENIAESYQRLRERKEGLELRITGQLKSSIDAYKAARLMETLHPADLLRGIDELVKAVLNPKKFSIFQLEGNMLTAAVTSGWANENEYPRIVTSKQDLYREIVGAQHALCVANPDNERALAGEGILAGPMIDRTSGEVMGMLKIEELGFAELNLSTIETFNALCEWVGMAFINARHFQSAKDSSMVNPEVNLMSRGYFKNYSDHITLLAKRVGFDVSMITVRLANPGDFDAEKRQKIARTLSESVEKTLRTVDLAFEHHANGEEFAVVLPATNTTGAQNVLGKITKELQNRMPKSLHAQFSSSVHSLNGK